MLSSICPVWISNLWPKNLAFFSMASSGSPSTLFCSSTISKGRSPSCRPSDDQLPILAVLGSAPIPYCVYSAPTFGIPNQSTIGQLLHVSCLPGSPDYFSIFPAVYPTSCRPSTATWLNDPRLSPSGLHSTVYWLLSPFDLVLQQLWRQPIISTHDFLFRIDWFPQPPRLATHVVKFTFPF